MRYVITHLKAPWPLGAVVGDVLELATVPVWAVGKCKPVEDEPAADSVFVVNPAESEPAQPKAKGKTK